MTTLPDPEAEETIQELSDSAVVAHSGSMALATLISRITGFVKLLLLTAILGAGYASAYSTANQLPNLIAALVLEATFTAIFVPVLTRAEREDADGGTAFIRKLLTIVTAILFTTTALSIAAAPLLSSLMLGGDPKVSQPLTTALAYLLLPQVFFYGLSSVFMAILNARDIFGPPAWAPVWNNVVTIAAIVLYWLAPGELTLDPLQMSDRKLLILGLGTTLGVAAQAMVLVPALRRQNIPLRPLWGIDDRLKRFAGMATAMLAYVAISQVGLIVTNRIAAGAADSGPIIYNNTWLILQLPYGLIGVTVLTAIMPRLSRNAAENDTTAVLQDMSLATRLTMMILIPLVAVMTVGGPAMGSALFAYGHFGGYDAYYLGRSISLSAFTLIAYALVLLQLRVFYAREQAWTPTFIIIAITFVKIVGSLLVPHLTDDPRLVAGYLGTANGLGFVVGACCGYLLLRRSLGRKAGPLLSRDALRTVLIAAGASLTAALIGVGIDRFFDLKLLTERGGGIGSLLRLAVLGLVMLAVAFAIMVAARVPEARAAAGALRRRASSRFGGHASVTGNSSTAPLTYPNADDPVVGNPPSATTTAIRPTRTAGYERKGKAVNETPGSPAGALPVVAVAGSMVADGRYRLLAPHGGPPGLQFWQATDTELNRSVALTIIDGSTFTADQVQDILSNTLRLSKIESLGLARVLDAVHEGNGGIVVAQWVRGGSLREVADTEPSAIGASRAMRSLAEAADAAFHAGSALDIDHPARIRISIDGDAVLAFPATLSTASSDEDIRGLGAVLYALITRQWPLADTVEPSGLAAATHSLTGEPLPLRIVLPSVPEDISDVATRALSNKCDSAAQVLADLDAAVRAPAYTSAQATTPQPSDAARTTAIVRSDTERPTPHAPAEPHGGIHDEATHGREEEEETDEDAGRHRKVFLIGLGIVAFVLVAIFVAIGIWVTRIFGNLGPLDRGNIGIGIPTTTGSSSSSTATAPGAPAKFIHATVFSPEGTPDQPDTAGLAIDGDPGTGWSTDTYQNADPFPSFKNGVGLMLDLGSPTALASVTINSPSVGTQVQIRSADSATPSSLDDTTEISATTPLQQGSTQIPITSSAPVSHVLVWISTLGTTNGDNRAQLNEITAITRS